MDDEKETGERIWRLRKYTEDGRAMKDDRRENILRVLYYGKRLE